MKQQKQPLKILPSPIQLLTIRKPYTITFSVYSPRVKSPGSGLSLSLSKKSCRCILSCNEASTLPLQQQQRRRLRRCFRQIFLAKLWANVTTLQHQLHGAINCYKFSFPLPGTLQSSDILLEHTKDGTWPVSIEEKNQCFI